MGRVTLIGRKMGEKLKVAVNIIDRSGESLQLVMKGFLSLLKNRKLSVIDGFPVSSFEYGEGGARCKIVQVIRQH